MSSAMNTPGEEHAPPAIHARISVVIPSYNRRTLLLRAIDSVLRQDCPLFELLVVDDGSTDGTADAVRAIMDKRIRLIRENVQRGANAARNRGLLEAKAPIVCFLDSDDEYEPHKLSTVLALFEEQPDLGTLVDSYSIVNPRKRAGQPEDLINPIIRSSDAFLAALFDSTVKSRRVRKSTSGMSVRRDVAIRAGLFDEKLLRRQDMEFLIRLARTARCATTDSKLWIKHEQPESISFTGDGFIATTLFIGRSHPEYAARRTNQAADVAIYLWECIKRRRFKQLRSDVRLLAREIGAGSTLTLVGRGVCAWQIEPRLEAILKSLRRDRRPEL